jgi:excinuclease ABC subunit B
VAPGDRLFVIAILYADSVTGSMERAMAETKRRREKQDECSLANGITPESIKSSSKDVLASPYKRDHVRIEVSVAEDAKPFLGSNFQATLRDLESHMREAAGNLEFEEAARLRDEIKRLKLLDLEFANDALIGAGEAVDTTAPKRMRTQARSCGGGEIQEGREGAGPAVLAAVPSPDLGSVLNWLEVRGER